MPAFIDRASEKKVGLSRCFAPKARSNVAAVMTVQLSPKLIVAMPWEEDIAINADGSFRDEELAVLCETMNPGGGGRVVSMQALGRRSLNYYR